MGSIDFKAIARTEAMVIRRGPAQDLDIEKGSSIIIQTLGLSYADHFNSNTPSVA